MKFHYYKKNLNTLSAKFRDSPIAIKKGQLWVGDSLQVSEWEKPFQEKLAKLCINAREELNIMEVGYGLGMASTIFSSSPAIINYSLIEAHPKIFSIAINMIGKKPNFIGYFAFWESVIDTFPKRHYDAVLLDAYLPLFDNKAISEYSPTKIKNYLLESLPQFSRVLSDEGRLVLVDVTNELHFSDNELRGINFRSFKKEEFEVEKSEECSNYCKDNYVSLIVLEA